MAGISEATVYARGSKADRRKIRVEMIAQAEIILRPLYPSKAQLRAAAKTMVDGALAKERSTK